jgi:lysylphosphatidylglycerol synthetase-like protein (DUF2156 family)
LERAESVTRAEQTGHFTVVAPKYIESTGLSLQHVINVDQQSGILSAEELKSLQAGKTFIIRYALLTAVLFGAAYLCYSNFSWAHTNALWFGIILCTSTSFVSFMLTEWAYHQPTGIFLMVSMGSVVVRLFNLAIAFGLGQFFLEFSPMALAASLLVSYFSYFVIEIIYIHNKALTEGQ